MEKQRRNPIPNSNHTCKLSITRNDEEEGDEKVEDGRSPLAQLRHWHEMGLGYVKCIVQNLKQNPNSFLYLHFGSNGNLGDLYEVNEEMIDKKDDELDKIHAMKPR